MIKPIDQNPAPYDVEDVLGNCEIEVDEYFSEPIEAENEEDYTSIIAETEHFFEPGGVLSQSAATNDRAYEYRSQQAQMSLAVARSLAENFNLCAEAPTGVGKSFAYLIPAIYYSRKARFPVVISTETITLQEQLIDKDIPFLKKLLPFDFNCSLAKGRSNYLCLRRLSLLSGDRKDDFLPLASLNLQIEQIKKWSSNSDSGSRDHINFRVDPVAWSYVCCEGGNCLRSQCTYFRRCFYFKERLAWENSDIIIANHAMFLTDLKIRDQEQGAGLLPAYSAVIIDEAHTLENNAAEHLGLCISSAGVTGFLNRLFNPENAKGLLLRGGEEAMELRGIIEKLLERVKIFFSTIDQYLVSVDKNVVRITQCGLFSDNLSGQLAAFRQTLQDYAAMQEDKDFKTELEANLSRCDALIDGITQFVNMDLNDHVYWIENSNTVISLHAAPLNVAAILHNKLFSSDFPVILSSATLTVNNSFNYFRQRIGFNFGQTLQLDSPFDANMVKICIPRQMPDPSTRENDYRNALLEAIPRFIRMTHGKAFVLFTSYQLLRFCADRLKEFFSELKLNLFIQGELNRSLMIREFKSDVDSVIFGTDSFWTGVDVPGEALSNVIVTKLPFPVPSHPLSEARSEIITANGRSSFMDYSLPEAVLKFRQGVGRLVRTKNDRGIIVILDSRIVNKRYGKIFLDSIPKYHIEYF